MGARLHEHLEGREPIVVLEPEINKASVTAVVYRAFEDTPTATTREYFGEAETTWGLHWTNGTAKPA